jgi:Ca2+-binding EF-hand superfamily protein
MKKYYLTAALVLGSGLALAGSALAGADCDEAGHGEAGHGKAGHGKAGHGSAERFGRLDTNKDGKVTLAELTVAREAWLTEVDSNKDGVATQAELEASHSAQHGKRIAQLFTDKDANKDGRLTREESQFPERRFVRSDTNGDGALTVAELNEKGKPGGAHATAKGRGGKLGHFDENGDGKVEREEVRKAAARQFTRLDQNSDGNLTSDELSRQRGHGHGKHRQGPGEKGTNGKATGPKTTAS